MGAKNLDVVITVIAVILVVLVWIMLYDSNRFVVRHYSQRDQRIKKPVKAVFLADNVSYKHMTLPTNLFL